MLQENEENWEGGGVRHRGSKAEALCEFRTSGRVTRGHLTILIATATWEWRKHDIHSVLLGIRVSINTPGRNSWLYQLLAVPLMGHFISWGSAFFIYRWTRWHYCFSILTGRFNKVIYYLSCRWHINGQIHFCFSFPLSDLAELSSFWNWSNRGSIHEVTHF